MAKKKRIKTRTIFFIIFTFWWGGLFWWFLPKFTKYTQNKQEKLNRKKKSRLFCVLWTFFFLLNFNFFLRYLNKLNFDPVKVNILQRKKIIKLNFKNVYKLFLIFFLLHIHDPLIAFGSLSNLIGGKKKKSTPKYLII